MQPLKNLSLDILYLLQGFPKHLVISTLKFTLVSLLKFFSEFYPKTCSLLGGILHNHTQLQYPDDFILSYTPKNIPTPYTVQYPDAFTISNAQKTSPFPWFRQFMKVLSKIM